MLVTFSEHRPPSIGVVQAFRRTFGAASCRHPCTKECPGWGEAFATDGGGPKKNTDDHTADAGPHFGGCATHLLQIRLMVGFYGDARRTHQPKKYLFGITTDPTLYAGWDTVKSGDPVTAAKVICCAQNWRGASGRASSRAAPTSNSRLFLQILVVSTPLWQPETMHTVRGLTSGYLHAGWPYGLACQEPRARLSAHPYLPCVAPAKEIY